MELTNDFAHRASLSGHGNPGLGQILKHIMKRRLSFVSPLILPITHDDIIVHNSPLSTCVRKLKLTVIIVYFEPPIIVVTVSEIHPLILE